MFCAKCDISGSLYVHSLGIVRRWGKLLSGLRHLQCFSSRSYRESIDAALELISKKHNTAPLAEVSNDGSHLRRLVNNTDNEARVADEANARHLETFPARNENNIIREYIN